MATAESLVTAAEVIPALLDGTAETGWYHDIPAEVYHRIPAMSASGMVAFNRSPAHYRHERDISREETDAMRLGTALHCALLEPEVFGDSYVVLGPCEAVLKSGRRAGEACGAGGKAFRDGFSYCGKHDPSPGEPMPLIPLSGAEADAITGMRDAVMEHPDASLFFRGRGASEVTGIWRDEDTGVLCKLRLDRDIERAAIHADVKSCVSAQEHAFRRHAIQMGYPLKAAWYRRGMAALDRDAMGSTLIAVEKTAPHGVQLFLVEEKQIETLNRLIDRNLARFAECLRTDVWPGYQRGMRTLEMLPWELEATGAEGDDE